MDGPSGIEPRTIRDFPLLQSIHTLEMLALAKNEPIRGKVYALLVAEACQRRLIARC